jgi:hypothetical protein
MEGLFVLVFIGAALFCVFLAKSIAEPKEAGG